MSEVGFIESEMADIFARLHKLGKIYTEAAPKIAAEGGAYFAVVAEMAAPRGSKIHKRYSTAKVNKAIRAPKGMGTVVATYSPGNLGNSMQILPLRRTKSAVYVGAKLAKGQAKGNFGSGKKADGFYMHMVEKGTNKWAGKPFFRAAWDRAKPTVVMIMTAHFKMIAERFNAENR